MFRNYNTDQPVVMRNTETRADVNVGHSSGSGSSMGFSIENQGPNNNWWTFYVQNTTGLLEFYYELDCFNINISFLYPKVL